MTLVEELRELQSKAKDSEFIKLRDKSIKYVGNQAGRGFDSCTLPAIKLRILAYRLHDYFVESGCQAHVSDPQDGYEYYLVKVIWAQESQQ